MSRTKIAEFTIAARTHRTGFRLSRLMVFVLGVALALGLVSRAHVPGNMSVTFGESPPTRWLGVVLAPVGVALALALTIQILSLLDRRRAAGSRKWAIFWRSLTLVSLAMLLSEEASALATVPAPFGEPNWPPGRVDVLALNTRLRVLPCAEGLLMAGLVLGLRAPRRRTPNVRNVLPAWSGAIMAGFGGLMIVATLMMIPYLVLIAIEAVENAKMHPGEASAAFWVEAAPRPMAVGLSDRLDASLPALGFASASVLLSGCWLASSLRRPRVWADQSSGRALAISIMLAVSLLGTAAYLVGVTLPAIQPMAAAGLDQTLDALAIGGIALGMLGFSAGLVASVVASEENPAAGALARASFPGGRPVSWLAKGGLAALASWVLLTCVDHIAGWFGWIGLAPAWWPEVVPLATLRRQLGEFGPDASLWLPALLLPWLAWRSLALLFVGSGSRRSAPLDLVFESPTTTRQFVGYLCVLWSLLLAAIPTLALTGLVFLHHALRSCVP